MKAAAPRISRPLTARVHFQLSIHMPRKAPSKTKEGKRGPADVKKQEKSASAQWRVTSDDLCVFDETFNASSAVAASKKAFRECPMLSFVSVEEMATGKVIRIDVSNVVLEKRSKKDDIKLQRRRDKKQAIRNISYD